ncbi:MAG TPA: deoxyribodipyrimidine photolyase [Thermoanaerobaculia bacterium]|nr:deoxyribodipyrimidine photolyase [Thermoanaerobaculia bacterium]
MTPIPPLRLHLANDAPVNPHGEYVLYWMIAARRAGWSFGLDRAVEWARELGKPLVVFEALRCGYRWASDRLHRFVLDGMADNQAAFAGRAVTYLPYVEPSPGAGQGLLAALGARACLVVTDDFPCFFLPRMVAAAAEQLPVRLEAVDGNGLLPMRAAGQTFGRAFDFRRFLQKELPAHLGDFPQADPLAGGDLPRLAGLPAEVLARWPAASPELLAGDPGPLAALPIDHAIRLAPFRGGSRTALAALAEFVGRRLPRYGERNEPSAEVTSGLSPYLHFGHVSAHEVFAAVAAAEDWSPSKLVGPAGGARHGFWRMSEAAEGFLDQLVTWRELGFNFCSREPDYDRYESLPGWARQTLDRHARDPRPNLYGLAGFEAAATHEEVWNAAQRQIVHDGVMHNYLRMVWGKMILEWSASPREALEVMIELNNKYGLDGRNPNSYSGICWCLGRYDRPWGPERPIFGTIRFMSPANTRRKLDLRAYLARWGGQARLGFDLPRG